MRICYTPRARNDLAEIYDYIHRLSPSGAVHVLREIHAGIDFIAEYPQASVITDDPQVRVKTVLRYRYRIFYWLAGDAVEILRVRHTSRRPL